MYCGLLWCYCSSFSACSTQLRSGLESVWCVLGPWSPCASNPRSLKRTTRRFFLHHQKGPGSDWARHTICSTASFKSRRSDLPMLSHGMAKTKHPRPSESTKANISHASAFHASAFGGSKPRSRCRCYKQFASQDSGQSSRWNIARFRSVWASDSRLAHPPRALQQHSWACRITVVPS